MVLDAPVTNFALLAVNIGLGIGALFVFPNLFPTRAARLLAIPLAVQNLLLVHETFYRIAWWRAE